jgi:hypothetical protein
MPNFWSTHVSELAGFVIENDGELCFVVLDRLLTVDADLDICLNHYEY